MGHVDGGTMKPEYGENGTVVTLLQDSVTLVVKAGGQRPNRLRLGRKAYKALCTELTKIYGTKVSKLKTFYGMRVSVEPDMGSCDTITDWENKDD